MTITTTTLTRAAGLSAVAAGLLFCAVQIGHPNVDLALVTTTEWKVRQTIKVLFAALSLIGPGWTGLRASAARSASDGVVAVFPRSRFCPNLSPAGFSPQAARPRASALASAVSNTRCLASIVFIVMLLSIWP